MAQPGPKQAKYSERLQDHWSSGCHSVLDFGLLETPGTSDEHETTFSSRGSCSSSSFATGPTPKAQGKQLWSTTIGSSGQSRINSSSRPGVNSSSRPGLNSSSGPGVNSSSRYGAASSTAVGSSSRTGVGRSCFSSTVGSSGTLGVSNYSTLSSGGGRLTSTSTTSRRPTTETPSLSRTSKTPGSFKTPRTGSSLTRTPGSRRTPHTTTTSATPGQTPRVFESSCLVALVEGRGLARGEIGMASMDFKCPELILSQFSDMQTYVKTITKLQMLNPLEIILPNTACEGGNMTSLSKLINDQFGNTSITTVQRKYFNEAKGLMYVKQLCVPEYSSVELEISSKYYCLAAGAALMKYIEFIQNIMFAHSSIKVVFKGSENTTMIDAATVRNLELLQNLRDVRSDHTLYGILNYTKTPGGARLLRSNILQPPSDLDTITMRQDVVSELTEKEQIFYNLEAVISRFLDIDHILSQCVQVPKQENVKIAENKISNMMYLKHILELVEPLREALGDCENPLLKASAQYLEDPRFSLMMNKINTVIHEEARYQKGSIQMRSQKCFAVKYLEDPRFSLMMNKINTVIHEEARYQKGSLQMRSQKCFAVKPHLNGMLDMARRAYTEIVDDISNLVTQMASEYNLPLKVMCNTSRGYYIQMYCGGKDGYSADNLPGVFIKVNKFKNTLSFTTTDIIKLNDRVKESLHEIYLMTNIVMSELLNEIRGEIGCLFKLSESVARLDMLLAFAHACTVSEFVRPEFTDTLAVSKGRHPILERITLEPPVPNNIYASEDSNFMIITGPNMSGKSTYLRQIALLQIMAQIGSFVPAEYASFRIASQIFSRIGSDDDLETNSSTFMLEMKEINYIMQTATPNSLIIVDELGRGTSPEEGVGLCFAICEYLLQLKAFTFFVTHFLELATLDTLYPNVENYFFEIQRSFSSEGNCEKVIYTHVLSRGKTEEKHYGIQLAEISTMPQSVITDAKNLAEKISEEKKNTQQTDKDLCKQRAVFKLATKLVQAARSSQLDEDSLRLYLKSLKKKYEEEIRHIEE